jgi:site-specific DNA-cytosine methylase
MKTYILHPDSFNGGTDRVISVREAWLIMGFSRSFQLPEKSSMWIRYQMAVDSVSPYFSRVAGRILKNLL